MSTIDDKSHLNQNQNAFSTNFIPNEQQQQQNETKKVLNGHRGNTATRFVRLDIFRCYIIIELTTGTSSLSRAVHAALANVIQDPIVTATGSTDVIAGGGGGDSPMKTNLSTCENCSKLRQQLTLLIYEVLNLENTMESKICEYVQRRLSEIALAEKLTDNIKTIDCNNNGILRFVLNIKKFSVNPFIFVLEDLSSNSSTCNYTLAQNNNHIIQETTPSSKFHQSTMKYRAERTLTFENVLIGDSILKYLDPARFDIERKTYIKTMVKFVFIFFFRVLILF